MHADAVRAGVAVEDSGFFQPGDCGLVARVGAKLVSVDLGRPAADADRGEQDSGFVVGEGGVVAGGAGHGEVLLGGQDVQAGGKRVGVGRDPAQRQRPASADNAAAEAFNASLKRGTLQGRRRWSGAREARLAVFRWATRYNTTRRHRPSATPARSATNNSPLRWLKPHNNRCPHIGGTPHARSARSANRTPPPSKAGTSCAKPAAHPIG
ncbi:integrase core domain-containing protein [Actinomadura madurae]